MLRSEVIQGHDGCVLAKVLSWRTVAAIQSCLNFDDCAEFKRDLDSYSEADMLSSYRALFKEFLCEYSTRYQQS